MKKYDLVIIGGGAAGFAAATVANDVGAKTVLINSGLPIGGTCVNVGCIPTKLLLEMAYDIISPQKPRFGSIPSVKLWVDFKNAIKEKDEVITKLRKSNYLDVLRSFQNVDFVEGVAKFKDKNSVEVNDEIFYGEKIIIATGSSPKILPFKGIDRVDYLTNRTALSLDELPSSIAVIGGGPLGLEFAQMFAMFGSKVYVIEKEKRILPFEEPEISNSLKGYLEEYGIEFYTNAQIQELSRENRMVNIRFGVQKDSYEIKVEKILIATGVSPNTSSLSLEKAGVETDEKGFVRVDKHMKTSQENIFAAGDCVGRMFLETVAAKEGNTAAQNALLNKNIEMDYDSVPHAVFTFPQVASVGLTERELMRRLNVCSCRTVNFTQVPKAKAVKRDEGIIKMVVNPHTSEVVGVHIVSHNAAEIIHEATIAVKFKLKVDDIIDTVHVFPTFSEAIKLAALAFKRDISVMSCCIV